MNILNFRPESLAAATLVKEVLLKLSAGYHLVTRNLDSITWLMVFAISQSIVPEDSVRLVLVIVLVFGRLLNRRFVLNILSAHSFDNA